MPLYAYTAVDGSGATQRGQIEAKTQNDAVETVLSSGLTPMRVNPASGALKWGDWIKYRQKDFTAADAGHFCADLYRLLHAGFSMRQALDVIALSAETKTVKALAVNAADKVAKGGRLSDVIGLQSGNAAIALAGLVRAGEKGGNLEDILSAAASSFQKGAEFKEKITSALIYPAIIGFLISMTLILFFSFILPQLEPLFAGSEDKLPRSTQLLLAFGRFFDLGLPLILIAFAALLVAIKFIPGIAFRLRRLGGRMALLPFFGGISRLTNYATYARVMSLLVGSGLPTPNAHMIAAQACANAMITTSLEGLSPALREGQALALCLGSVKSAPTLLVNMAQVGERSGRIAAALGDAADILERRASRRMDRALSALTPMITIVLGLIVALVVGALFMGISSLTDVSAF